MILVNQCTRVLSSWGSSHWQESAQGTWLTSWLQVRNKQRDELLWLSCLTVVPDERIDICCELQYSEDGSQGFLWEHSEYVCFSLTSGTLILGRIFFCQIWSWQIDDEGPRGRDHREGQLQDVCIFLFLGATSEAITIGGCCQQQR